MEKNKGRMNKKPGIPFVELRTVTKRFSDVIAVNKVNIKIEKGEIFSLVGPSGCGKTTTLRLIGGLENPDNGEILIHGEVVNNIPPYKRDCSIVFQNLALFPHMSVAENIAFGLEQRKVSKSEIKKRVEEVLDLINLSGMEERRPTQLSGGQQQRIALARSLVIGPGILLLDEPLASLDRKLRKGMQVELKRIQKEVGVTFLYVTHDQAVALALSDRVAVMREGKLVQVGTPEDIYEKPKTMFTADFMGATNIFSGKIVSTSGRKLHFKTEEGLKLFASVREDICLEDVEGISVRPEDVEVTEKDAPGDEDNKFEGKILERVYQGDFTELVISLTGGVEITTHVKRREFSVNDEILVKWRCVDCNLLIS